jgi:PqqD family protein of HPr-rel-A system
MTLPDSRPKHRDGLTIVELDGEAVVYDEHNGELHHLNPSATVALSLCDGTRTVEQMADEVSNAFGVSVQDVLPQMRSVLERFAEAGLLAGA